MKSAAVLLSIAFGVVGIAFIAAQNLWVALGVIMAIIGHAAFMNFTNDEGDE